MKTMASNAHNTSLVAHCRSNWKRRAVHGLLWLLLTGLAGVFVLQTLNWHRVNDPEVLSLPLQHDKPSAVQSISWWQHTMATVHTLERNDSQGPDSSTLRAGDQGQHSDPVPKGQAAAELPSHKPLASQMTREAPKTAPKSSTQPARQQHDPGQHSTTAGSGQHAILESTGQAPAVAASTPPTVGKGNYSSSGHRSTNSAPLLPVGGEAVRSGSLPGAGTHSTSTAAAGTLGSKVETAGSKAVTWVSASEGLKLTAAYSQALSALSATLAQARQRAEEAAALKQRLDELRMQQHLQMLPLQLDQPSLLLGQQEQQGQQQLLQPLEASALGSLQATNHLINISASNKTLPSDVATQPASAAPANAALRANHSAQRDRVRMFIGVYTGISNGSQVEPRYNYTMRRAMLRATWFPGNEKERQRLEQQHGVVLRFVVGSVKDPAQDAQLMAEQQQHGDILRLPLEEGYASLPNKTRTFFKVVTDQWEPEWVLKMDDDVYLNPSRLLAASRQWDKMGAEYVGCMKHGYPWKLPGTRWYEPANLLVGYTYWLHAYGSIYAIASRVARSVIGANWSQLRLLANEDTSVGLWMLAANVTYFEDMRLCSPTCTPASVGVLRNECAGLCNPLLELPALHNSSNCSGAPGTLLRYHASYPAHKAFEKMWVA